MKITPKKISIGQLTQDYIDKSSEEKGVTAYGGKLDIRPPYQRNFVYSDEKRNAVIESIKNEFPLNTIYWADNGKGRYEVIDGQQRIISICEYVHSNFSVNWNGEQLEFHNLKGQQKKFLDYKLDVYLCKGPEHEKIKWFRIINIAPEVMKPQELRNAVYRGKWVSDAKIFFSKRNGPAYSIGHKYVNSSKSAERQEYLELAIKWDSINKIKKKGISESERIDLYMQQHQNNNSAKDLKKYFENVIAWIELNFKKYNKKISQIDWGIYYNKFKKKKFNVDEIEKEVSKLLLDDDVSDSGIYPYIITGEEKHLNIRAFTLSMKLKVHEIQKGKCKNSKCNVKGDLENFEFDHIVPWSKNGRTEIDNCQMLCIKHHKELKNR